MFHHSLLHIHLSWIYIFFYMCAYCTCRKLPSLLALWYLKAPKDNFEQSFHYVIWIWHCCIIMAEMTFINWQGIATELFHLEHIELNKGYVDENTLTISLFNNSEKLVQILLEFRRQIVEGKEFVLAKFCWKRPLSVNQNLWFKPLKGWKFLAIFYICVQNAREVSCAKI